MCTQSVSPAGSGPTASSSVNVRMAASVTDRPDGAAAAPAGSESSVREVRRPVCTCTTTYRRCDLTLHCGNCSTGYNVCFC